jgi:kynurenine 3-monooxygenase
LAIYYIAGHTVHIYDRSPDIRQIQFSGRSINLAMFNRGWRDGVGVGDAVREIAIPMDKRQFTLLINSISKLWSRRESIYSISRGILNRK